MLSKRIIPIKCAAFELPFGTTEVFGRESVQEILRILSEEGLVHLAEAQAPGEEAHWHWTSESYPADAISLRSVSSDNFVVVDSTDATRVIGETDFTSGPSTLHEKAIYIVEGQLYQVERLDVEGRKAYVREVDSDYYTDAISYTKVTILDTFESTGAGASPGSQEAAVPGAAGRPAGAACRGPGAETFLVYVDEGSTAKEATLAGYIIFSRWAHHLPCRSSGIPEERDRERTDPAGDGFSARQKSVGRGEEEQPWRTDVLPQAGVTVRGCGSQLLRRRRRPDRRKGFIPLLEVHPQPPAWMPNLKRSG